MHDEWMVITLIVGIVALGWLYSQEIVTIVEDSPPIPGSSSLADVINNADLATISIDGQDVTLSGSQL